LIPSKIRFIESVFDYPGDPVIKIGILLITDANRENTFSLKAKFLAILSSGFNLSKKSFYKELYISKNFYWPSNKILSTN
jgi:hypothetical protein